jgi:hypothetical protein
MFLLTGLLLAAYPHKRVDFVISGSIFGHDHLSKINHGTSGHREGVYPEVADQSLRDRSRRDEP